MHTTSPGARPRARASRDDGTAFLLSFLLPGCGHVFLGHAARGVAWSVAFLLGLLPGAVVAYVLWSDTGPLLLVALPIVGLLFCFASGWSARRLSVRGPMATRRPPLWRLETYAALVCLAAVLEVRVFAESSLASCTVASPALQPVAAPGDWCVVVLTRYVRPVHGDVVLLRPGLVAHEGAPLAGTLARVLAGPGDTLEGNGSQLHVNGIVLDLARSDQRVAVVMAGRKLGPRVARALAPGAPRIEGRAGDPRWLAWGLESSATVPRGTLVHSALVVPDAPGWEGLPARGLLVHDADIVGRAIR